jgi:hypothetical protein
MKGKFNQAQIISPEPNMKCQKLEVPALLELEVG